MLSKQPETSVYIPRENCLGHHNDDVANGTS